MVQFLMSLLMVLLSIGGRSTDENPSAENSASDTSDAGNVSAEDGIGKTTDADADAAIEPVSKKPSSMEEDAAIEPVSKKPSSMEEDAAIEPVSKKPSSMEEDAATDETRTLTKQELQDRENARRDAFSPEDVYKEVARLAVTIEAMRGGDIFGQGSGFQLLVQTTNYRMAVITNEHVIRGADRLRVIPFKGKAAFIDSAMVVDADKDIAVLSAPKSLLAGFEFKTDFPIADDPEVGATVYAIGGA